MLLSFKGENSPGVDFGGKIDITWSDASDDESGVYGYSVVWDNSQTTIPDLSVDILDTQMTSPSIGDDIWYFHVKTVDNVNNWAGDVYHAGPFNALPITGAIWRLGSGLIGIVGVRRKFKK